MDYQGLWALMQETWLAIRDRYEPDVQRITQESGIEVREWGLLLAALTFEPENITPGHLLIRGPYTAAEEYLRRLRFLAEKGFLREVSDASFSLTSEGRMEVVRFIAELRQVMASVDPLPLPDSRRLVDMLYRLIQACLSTPPPPEHWSIRLSFKLMPSLEPPLPSIEQAFSCLAAHRDDSHLAAWRDSSLSATALETLTLVWRGQANSFDELMTKLAPRGHSAEVYLNALEQLKIKGLISGSPNAIRITSKGKEVRDKIEEDTDHYFYIPWTCFNESDLNEMKVLLERLCRGLKHYDL